VDSLQLAARLVKGIRQSDRSLHDLNRQREARIAELLKLIELASSKAGQISEQQQRPISAMVN